MGESLETEALIRTVKEQITKIVTLGKVISPEVMVIVENMQEAEALPTWSPAISA